MTKLPPNLTLKFLDDFADGLRLITHSNWTIECLLCSRSKLPRSLSNESTCRFLDVPGVYLLIGQSEQREVIDSQKLFQLYVGQGDSVADRLNSHIKNQDKNWFHTVVVFRRQDKHPLNITYIKYLESKLCELALNANTCVVTNKNAPQLPAISCDDQDTVEDFLGKALIIASAVGWNFFELIASAPPSDEVTTPSADGTVFVQPSLVALLDEIHTAVTDASFPRSKWYPTRTDYRARCVVDNQFRVFLRVKCTRNWFRLEFTDVGRLRVKDRTDLNAQFHEAMKKAYTKAEDYLRKSPAQARAVMPK